LAADASSRPASSRAIAGVDGSRLGWAAAIDPGTGVTAVRLFPTFADLLACRALALIVIDVPIGLPSRGARACDVEARRMLGRRRGSVFPAPLRAMGRARSWTEACAIGWRADGRACSRQTYGILPKVREVDALMTRARQRRVREGHPELAFALLNGGVPLASRKLTGAGRRDRLALLGQHFPDARERIGTLRGIAGDLVDAYACLWTARRLRGGTAFRMPGHPVRDRRGLRAEIVA
jgi:predicted RNase H-like nuclease